MIIPALDMKLSYTSIKKEIDEAIHKVLDNSRFIGGESVKNFELNFSKLIGVDHCIAVGNGTDALTLALKSFDIKHGDEVVTTAMSFIASSEAISATGATPRFVDIDAHGPNISITLLDEFLSKNAKSVGGKVKCVIAVHLHGENIDIKHLLEITKKYDVRLIEDCAQSHLSQQNNKCSGTLGDAATFSFYPGKNLGAFGDAGAVVTNDPDTAEKIRMLANHGRISKYDHLFEGFNSRMDTIQAEVLIVKMKYIREWTSKRIEAAAYYNNKLDLLEVTKPTFDANFGHVYHHYEILINKDRDKVLNHLKEKGVGAIMHYPIALPLLKAYSKFEYKITDFQNAYNRSQTNISIPIFPEITRAQQDYVIEKLQESLRV